VSLLFRRDSGSRPEAVAAEARSVSFQDVYGVGGPIDLYGSSGTLSLIPLFAAHRTIIDAVASTPLHAYRAQNDGTSQRLPIQPALLRSPSFGTPFTWKAQCISGLVSDGNAFGLITSIGVNGWPDALMWVNPYDVTIDDSKLEDPKYYYRGARIDPGSLLHIPWILPPGKLRGLSPLRAFKTAFEMGAAAQVMGRDWFVNGAIPGGHLKNTARTLKTPEAQEAKAVFRASVEGRDVLVTGSDWDYTTIGVPADEARFIETLKLSATQIATIYGLPPEDLGGDSGGSLTYATVEGNERRKANGMRPWAVRVEEAISTIMARPVYAKFNLDAGVRADLKTRMESHEIALRTGLETQSEARRLEDRPPLSDLERAEWLATWRPPNPTTPATREQA
jgi:HK97 family phage portal protein